MPSHYKHFYKHDKDAITGPSFKIRERPSRWYDQVVEQVRTRERGLRENAFYGRTSRIWNELPRHVAEANSINALKNALDKHLEKHPWKFHHSHTLTTSEDMWGRSKWYRGRNRASGRRWTPWLEFLTRRRRRWWMYTKRNGEEDGCTYLERRWRSWIGYSARRRED